MEQDELQILIDKAKKNLSRESKEAIDNVNWKLTILEMAGKYKENQLNTLEIETELLLGGILSPEVYQKELQNRMMLTEEEVSSLLNEMDKLIFKKIQGELEKIIEREGISSKQEVVSSKEGGVITNDELRITNERAITDYQPARPHASSGAGGLPITDGQVESSKQEVVRNAENTENKSEDEVPKPPYVISSKQQVVGSKEEEKITNDELRIKNEEKIITDYQPARPHASSGAGGLPITDEKVESSKEQVESSKEGTNSIQNVVSSKVDTDNKEQIQIKNQGKSIFEEKLKGPTASEHNVSDYSSKTPDPYREEF